MYNINVYKYKQIDIIYNTGMDREFELNTNY